MQCFGIFFLQETYAPKLLAWKRDKLIKETGNTALHTEFDSPDRTLATTLKIAMQRPFILLGTQPILQVLACYMAYLYGLMYLMLSTFPRLWTGQYRMSAGIGSLNFISMGAGFFLGTQITAPLNDMLYRRLKKRNNGVGKPEFRVPIMVPASLLVPAGLFWYGWSAQADLHWIVSNLFLPQFVIIAEVLMFFRCRISAQRCSAAASSSDSSVSRRTLSTVTLDMRPAPLQPQPCSGVWRVSDSRCLRRRCITRWTMVGGTACWPLWRWGWVYLRRSCCGSSERR